MSDPTTQDQQARPRRRAGRRTGTGAGHLEELLAARTRLDADQARRRELEDLTLDDYAATIEEADTVRTDHTRRLADLDRQREQINTDTASRLADIQRRQAAGLVALNDLGRNADELAALVGMPVKQVRTLLREHRASTPPSSEPSTATTTDVAQGVAGHEHVTAMSSSDTTEAATDASAPSATATTAGVAGEPALVS